jgi:AcrR family transcriptional regulator
MAAQTHPSAEPRVPLNRDRVLRAAIRLADEGGFESLTMRKLGQELGVQAMSLYNHVANKDDIRDGIVDVVMEEVEVPSNGTDWKAAIRQSAISHHDVLLRHRWACSLMMATPRVSRPRLRWMEWLLQTLREAGFSANMTHHAYHALDSHIMGFTLWQVSFPFDTREELLDLAKDFLREIPAEEYPYVIEHAEQHMAEPNPDEPSEFEFGLDLILDGLERIRDAGSAQPAGH